jgi:hypothetical protein
MSIGLPYDLAMCCHEGKELEGKATSDTIAGQVLISSIKGEVKKKHISNGRTISCFPAHLMEQDLF